MAAILEGRSTVGRKLDHNQEAAETPVGDRRSWRRSIGLTAIYRSISEKALSV